MGEHSDRYPKTQYDLLQENERAIRDATRNRQKDKQGTDAVTALHQHAQDVQRANPRLLPGAFPVIHDRMSPQDVVAAHVRMNELGGMSPTDARDPARIGSQANNRTGLVPVGTPPGAVPLPPASGTPAKAPSSSLPAYSLPRSADGTVNQDDLALLKETHTRDQAAAAAARAPAPVSIPAGDPEARAFFGKPSTPEPGAAVAGALPLPPVAVPATPANPATAAAAGTGATVATPYGTGSSHYVPKGTVEAPAVVSDTGVQRQPTETWQQAILRKYPKVGIEGSPENLAFVENFKQLQATAAKDPSFKFDPNVDSHRIAGRLFDNDPVFRAKQDAKSNPSQADLNRLPSTPAPAAPVASTPATPAAPIPVQGSNPGELFASAAARVAQKAQAVGYTNPGQFITDIIRPPAAPAAAPISSIADLRMQDAKPNPPYDLTSGTAAPPAVPTPPIPTTSAQPTSASTGASAPLPLPPTGSKPLSYNSSGGAGQYNLPAPDPDSEAFAQNPQEDQFKKQMREAKQLSYAS